MFDFAEATAEDINKIIKSVNPKKAIGPHRIPLKIIKTVANFKGLKENKFSENAEIALVRPIER